MADTLGSLIDKLCTVDMKLWSVMEFYYLFPKQYSQEEFLKVFSHPKKLRMLYDKVAKQTDLNVQRANLIDEIDQLVAGSIKSGDVSRLVQRKYKTGS